MSVMFSFLHYSSRRCSHTCTHARTHGPYESLEGTVCVFITLFPVTLSSGSVAGKILSSPSKNVHVPMPRICDHVTSYCTSDFADAIKERIARGGDDPA